MPLCCQTPAVSVAPGVDIWFRCFARLVLQVIRRQVTAASYTTCFVADIAALHRLGEDSLANTEATYSSSLILATSHFYILNLLMFLGEV